MLHKLHYISQGQTPEVHIQHIASALNAGVKLVQLRLKNLSNDQYTEYAIQAKELCGKFGAQLIINDNPIVAKASSADALHLGLDDMPVSEAKKIVSDKSVGGTANTFEHIQQRCKEGVDYIGLGPFQFTTTKEKLSPVLGVSGYTNIIQKMKAEQLTTPVYAIGGIELKDIESIIKTGVYGIAVSGLITNSNNKEHLVKEINKILYHA
ncbi:MAG: thiamine phosphate synthase [Bacteroidetes bacterium]|jgi:thiamine-phosphate pyrophosphorylase|nr:thiamine phosphate synthase [Bacteroidota bacterium]MDF2451055.1 thiamine phosphate synthase [Bacteroidota bacterium]